MNCFKCLQCEVSLVVAEGIDSMACGNCKLEMVEQSPQPEQAEESSLGAKMLCAHCGGTIDHRTLLGETIFSCSNCWAETRFKKEGLSIGKQMEKFKRRSI